MKEVRVYVGTTVAYAAVELLILELLRWAVRPDVFVATPPGFTLAALGIYVLAGCVGGVVHAIFLKAIPPQETSAAVLSALFAMNAAAHCHRAVIPVVTVAVLLMGIAVLSWRSSRLRERLMFLTMPLAVSTLLLAPDWVANDRFARASHPTRTIAFAVTTVGVVALARAVVRIAPRGTTVRALLIAMIVIAALLIEPVAKRGPRPTIAPAPSSPNVLFVTLDTIRADHLSIYGYGRDTTPFLRRWSLQTTLYRRAFAPSNMTLSSHASFFTGLFPSQHGAHPHRDGPVVRPLIGGVPTLAEIFVQRGYDVSGIAANYAFLGAEFGLDRGFQQYFCRPGATTLAAIGRSTIYDHVMPPRFTALKKHVLRYPVWQLLVGKAALWPVTPDIMPASEVTRRAIESLPKRGGRPFFLFVNYFDAHAPYLPPAPHDRRFTRDDNRPRGFSSGDYDGAIAFIDQQLGVLVERLRELGLYDNTLIVVTSDHGEAFGEHGMLFHGSSTYDEQVRVPLVIKRPRQTAGHVVSSPVNTVQLFDVIRSVGRHELHHREVISEGFPLDADITTSVRPGRAFIADNYKLIVSRAAAELYDLQADASEARNLAADDPQRVSSMTQTLKAWIAVHPPRLRPRTSALPREAVEKLRALGYIR